MSQKFKSRAGAAHFRGARAERDYVFQTAYAKGPGSRLGNDIKV